MPHVFTVTGEREVDLGRGYKLYPRGFVGGGTALEPADMREGLTRSASTQAVITADMQAAFDRAGVEELQTIQLEIAPAPEGGRMRSGAHGDSVVLITPDAGPDKAMVVMVADEDGGISFHLPVSSPEDEAVEPVAKRGANGQKTFILRSDAMKGEPQEAATRGLVSAIGKKLVQVLALPALKATAEFAARKFEERSRPYGIRRFGPDEYTVRLGTPLASADWERLGAGRALLFIHGTFSTSAGGFGGLPEELMKTLDARYHGRVFAFNHHSLSASPTENVAYFLDQIPAGVSLSLDVVSHSRGGLVARVLAGGHPALSVDPAVVNVERVLCAATPNHGTPLAEAEHIKHLLDRLGTMASLVPGTAVDDIMDFVFGVLAVLAEGILDGLPGLAAMDPTSSFLAELNGTPAPGVEFVGVAAEYEPKERGLQRIIKGALDVGVDYIFRDVANDIVVPTLGVSSGNSGFHIDKMLTFDQSRGATHTSLWNQSGEIRDSFVSWLPG